MYVDVSFICDNSYLRSDALARFTACSFLLVRLGIGAPIVCLSLAVVMLSLNY